MKFYLIVAKGKRRGFPVPISVDLFIIGSDPECQLRATHPQIGGQHCAVAIRGRKGFVRDLASGHPTLVNGVELPASEEWPLHKGDRLGVGPLEFRVSFNEKTLAKADLEEWALKTLDEDTGPKVSALDELDRIKRGPDDLASAASVAEAMIRQMSASKGVVRGRLRIMRDGPVTVVRVNDNYLVEGPELTHIKRELFDNLNAPNLRVLLDLKNVAKMSSAAVTMFGELAHWLQGRGGTLAVCRLRRDLAAMLDGVAESYDLPRFDTKEAAVAAQW